MVVTKTRDGTATKIRDDGTGRDRDSSVRVRLEAWNAKYGF